MKTGKEIRKIIKDLRKELNINVPVYIRVLPLKRSLASISLKTHIIRLNSDFIKRLTPEEIRFVLVHELLHLKYGDVHSTEMRNEILKHCSEEVISSTMKKVESFLKQN